MNLRTPLIATAAAVIALGGFTATAGALPARHGADDAKGHVRHSGAHHKRAAHDVGDDHGRRNNR